MAKLNQISPASSSPAVTDQVVGVGGATTDLLYSVSQLMGAFGIQPSGRLTLTSATPVLTSSVSGATTVYFTPYRGNYIPVSLDGSTFVWLAFGELSQATTDTTKSPAAVAASKVYDVFVWSDSGTLRATRGPAWSTSNSRGTGAGTTELTLLNGFYVNKNAITNGPGANRGTYVGSIASNGSSTIDFILGGSASLGTQGFLYVWNNYNRVLTHARTQDTHATYTYTGNTWRNADNSAGMQINFLVGLQEDSVHADRSYSMLIPASTTQAAAGIGYDSTTAEVFAYTLSAIHYRGSVSDSVAPTIGTHFLAAVEISDGTRAVNFNENASDLLNADLPM